MENIPSVAVQGYFLDGTVFFWNRASEHLYGYSAAEAMGRNLLDLIVPADMQEAVRGAIRQMAESGEAIPSSELLLKRKDDSLVPVFSSHALIQARGRQPELFCLDVDLTELKRAEDALRETEELFSLFMKYTPVYTFIKQLEENTSRVIQMSDNFIDMLGRPAAELRGRTMEQLFPADFARKITADDIAVVNDEKVIQLEEELNGRMYTTIKFPIIRKGKDKLLAGFTIDITDRRRAEEERQRLEKQILHAQKLESLGVLAGGIAHDFNNILTSVLGNTELALMRLNPESPAIENLRRVEKAAVRPPTWPGRCWPIRAKANSSSSTST